MWEGAGCGREEDDAQESNIKAPLSERLSVRGSETYYTSTTCPVSRVQVTENSEVHK